MSFDTVRGVTWLVIKLMSILGLGLYVVYAGIMVRQEQMMTQVLEESSEALLRIFALVHLIAAVAVLALAIILL